MVLATGPDVEEFCNSKQLCTGVQAGIEGAIHAMDELFSSNADKGWCMLLVDASNAFNSVNRSSALLNARFHWPRCSRFLYNTYQRESTLKVQGANELLYSREGVTQGDPLSMLLYSIAVMPLIRRLEEESVVTQNWYADDAAAVGELDNVMEWMGKLLQHGPKYGYYPEPKKSILIVHPDYMNKAKEMFETKLGVTVVSGQRFLGGFVGSIVGKERFVKEKVREWCGNIATLSDQKWLPLNHKQLTQLSQRVYSSNGRSARELYPTVGICSNH
jgi:hypothetical protein